MTSLFTGLNQAAKLPCGYLEVKRVGAAARLRKLRGAWPGDPENKFTHCNCAGIAG
jgi:hypothetical protein